MKVKNNKRYAKQLKDDFATYAFKKCHKSSSSKTKREQGEKSHLNLAKPVNHEEVHQSQSLLITVTSYVRRRTPRLLMTGRHVAHICLPMEMAIIVRQTRRIL